MFADKRKAHAGLYKRPSRQQHRVRFPASSFAWQEIWIHACRPPAPLQIYLSKITYSDLVTIVVGKS